MIFIAEIAQKLGPWNCIMLELKETASFLPVN